MHELGTSGLPNQSASIPARANPNLVPGQIGIGVGTPAQQQIGRAAQDHKVLHIVRRLQLAQDGLAQGGRGSELAGHSHRPHREHIVPSLGVADL